MAEFSLGDLEQGIGAAIQRLNREGLSFPAESRDTTLNLVAGVIGPWPAQLTPRFVRLFAENVTVAVAARGSYQEAPLTLDEATAYLAVDSWFKNSWNHA